MIFPCRITRRRGTLALACLLPLAGPGCDRGNDQAASRASTLTVLDRERTGPGLSRFVFLQMVLPDENGVMQGRLAKSWEHSADYRTWTYHLRTDVRWQDGVPTTAHDVKFTMDLLSHPEVLENAPGSYSTAAPDDSTFVITYNEGFAQTQPKTWDVYLPKHLLEDLDPAGYHSWDFWKRPVGNGPYRYVRHVPQTFVEFEVNPDYALARPKIDRLIIKFGPPSVTELLSGNVDVVQHFRRGTEFLAIKDDPRFRVYYEIWDDILILQVILWNQRNPLFRDARVRRALTLAIDRRLLHGVLNMSADIPIFDVAYTRRQYWQREVPEGLPYDPERARELLDEAGWQDIDGDGIRERDGEAFTFSLMVDRDWQAAAVFIQAQLRQMGIRVDITMLGSGMRELTHGGQFDAAITSLWSGISGPNGLLSFFGEDSPIGNRNTRITQLLEAAQNTDHPDEMDEIFRGLMAIFAEELPFTYLVLNVETYVAHRRVKGMSTPYRANVLYSVEHLWLEDER